MPSLDVSELNIVLAILGTFIVLYGWISVKIKAQWYLGEACKSIHGTGTDAVIILPFTIVPAVVIGIMLGPIAAKFLDADRWGSAAPEQMGAITLVRLFVLPTQALV